MCVSVWVCVLGVTVGNQGFFMILSEMRCLVDIYLERLGGQQGMFLQWLGALSTELFTVMGQDELITEADGELQREKGSETEEMVLGQQHEKLGNGIV